MLAEILLASRKMICGLFHSQFGQVSSTNLDEPSLIEASSSVSSRSLWSEEAKGVGIRGTTLVVLVDFLRGLEVALDPSRLTHTLGEESIGHEVHVGGFLFLGLYG